MKRDPQIVYEVSDRYAQRRYALKLSGPLTAFGFAHLRQYIKYINRKRTKARLEYKYIRPKVVAWAIKPSIAEPMVTPPSMKLKNVAVAAILRPGSTDLMDQA